MASDIIGCSGIAGLYSNNAILYAFDNAVGITAKLRWVHGFIVQRFPTAKAFPKRIMVKGKGIVYGFAHGHKMVKPIGMVEGGIYLSGISDGI